eukprot:m.83981 g.83981  ORF g.83981 m.83981 type:complete len:484 (-) comp12140_c1_seq3:56-1507(-)
MILAKVGRELASRGHEVTLVRSNLDSNKVNTEGLNVHNIQLPTTKDYMEQRLLDIADAEPLDGLSMIIEDVIKFCNVSLKDEALWKAFKEADVALVDPNYLCSVVIAELAGTPIKVHLAATNFYDGFVASPLNVPDPVATVPQAGTRLTCEMSFFERVFNTINFFVIGLLREYTISPPAEALMKEYGNNRKFYDIFDDASVAIFQTDFSFEFPRSIPSHARMVGPILPDPGQPIQDEKLRAIMDGATDGFVLVSMGTVARLSDQQAQVLASAFTKLGLPVVWKLNGDHNLEVGDNVHIVDWIEQNNVLAHPNIVAFLAHGGANGVLEAAYHGVPLVGFPMFADQWDNIMRHVYRGTGLIVEKDTATPESVLEALNKVINDKSFSVNAKEISAAIRDHRRTSTQRAADAVEWAQHRGTNLRHIMPSTYLAWYVNMGLDVAVFLGAVAFSVCVFLLWSAAFVLSVCCGKKKEKKKSTNGKNKKDK